MRRNRRKQTASAATAASDAAMAMEPHNATAQREKREEELEAAAKRVRMTASGFESAAGAVSSFLRSELEKSRTRIEQDEASEERDLCGTIEQGIRDWNAKLEQIKELRAQSRAELMRDQHNALKKVIA
jgi:hypothetical protein